MSQITDDIHVFYRQTPWRVLFTVMEEIITQYHVALTQCQNTNFRGCIARKYSNCYGTKRKKYDKREKLLILTYKYQPI